MALHYSHSDIHRMDPIDQQRFQVIRRAGLPIPNPVSSLDLAVLIVEANALNSLRGSQKDRELAVCCPPVVIFIHI